MCCGSFGGDERHNASICGACSTGHGATCGAGRLLRPLGRAPGSRSGAHRPGHGRIRQVPAPGARRRAAGAARAVLSAAAGRGDRAGLPGCQSPLALCLVAARAAGVAGRPRGPLHAAARLDASAHADSGVPLAGGGHGRLSAARRPATVVTAAAAGAAGSDLCSAGVGRGGCPRLAIPAPAPGA